VGAQRRSGFRGWTEEEERNGRKTAKGNGSGSRRLVKEKDQTLKLLPFPSKERKRSITLREHQRRENKEKNKF
jgi:hypothetical protein